MYGMIQKPSTHLGAYEKLLGREVSKVVLRLRVTAPRDGSSPAELMWDHFLFRTHTWQ
jgi:hypothetical protein